MKVSGKLRRLLVTIVLSGTSKSENGSFLAAISGMVYAQSLMEDESQRFFYLCFCRETKLEYIQGKIIANLGLTSITFSKRIYVLL